MVLRVNVYMLFIYELITPLSNIRATAGKLRRQQQKSFDVMTTSYVLAASMICMC
jgi:hypothetical protein